MTKQCNARHSRTRGHAVRPRPGEMTQLPRRPLTPASAAAWPGAAERAPGTHRRAPAGPAATDRALGWLRGAMLALAVLAVAAAVVSWDAQYVLVRSVKHNPAVASLEAGGIGSRILSKIRTGWPPMHLQWDPWMRQTSGGSLPLPLIGYYPRELSRRRAIIRLTLSQLAKFVHRDRNSQHKQEYCPGIQADLTFVDASCLLSNPLASVPAFAELLERVFNGKIPARYRRFAPPAPFAHFRPSTGFRMP